MEPKRPLDDQLDLGLPAPAGQLTFWNEFL